MAYFSNGSEGECFDEECAGCRYGETPCPIACAQMAFNYEAVNNKVASGILNMLVANSGKCAMKALIDEHDSDLLRRVKEVRDEKLAYQISYSMAELIEEAIPLDDFDRILPEAKG